MSYDPGLILINAAIRKLRAHRLDRSRNTAKYLPTCLSSFQSGYRKNEASPIHFLSSFPDRRPESRFFFNPRLALPGHVQTVQLAIGRAAGPELIMSSYRFDSAVGKNHN